MAKRNQIRFEDSFNHYDVFKQELNLNYANKGLCVWHSEKSPSLSVFKSEDGNWLCKCFGCGYSTNLWGFLMKKHNLTYQEAVEYVKNGNFKLNKPEINIEKIHKETLIEFSEQPFTKSAHKYWNSFCLEEDFLKKQNIFQVRAYAINEKMVKIPQNQDVFAFYAIDEDKVKLLTIGENVKNKWISNLKTSYLWYYHEYEGQKIKDFFVVKSVKDRCVLKLLGYEGIALQNEAATTFLKNNVAKIATICDKPIICMGADFQGFTTSKTITDATGYRWFNTKKYLLRENINDVASFCSEFSLEALDKQIKTDLKKWKNI